METKSQTISLRIHYNTAFGQGLYVAGARWDQWKDWQAMTWNEGCWWELLLEIPANETLEYKYIVLDKSKNESVWEGCGNRTLTANPSSDWRGAGAAGGLPTMLVVDQWGQPEKSTVSYGEARTSQKELELLVKDESTKKNMAQRFLRNGSDASTKNPQDPLSKTTAHMRTAAASTPITKSLVSSAPSNGPMVVQSTTPVIQGKVVSGAAPDAMPRTNDFNEEKAAGATATTTAATAAAATDVNSATASMTETKPRNITTKKRKQQQGVLKAQSASAKQGMPEVSKSASVPTDGVASGDAVAAGSAAPTGFPGPMALANSAKRRFFRKS